MKIIGRYLGLVLGVLSVLLFKLFQVFPDFLERIYTAGVYRFIRFLYSYSLTYIPFPILYLFILLVLILLVNFFRRKERKRRAIPAALNFVGWMLFIFYWSWGFNYARTDFAERIDLPVNQPDSTFLFTELQEVDSILVGVRRQIQTADSVRLGLDNLAFDFQEKIHASQVLLIKRLGEPAYRSPLIRELKPSGSLLRIKTAGVYFPFVFEGHIDNGLHPIEKPYVMAHEMAHAHAFTDEGVCNFLGFMTCVNSEDPFIQYSGWLEYQGYLYRALRRNFPKMLENSNYRLPLAVRTDLLAIRERLDKYPSIAPKLRDFFYNNYLKAQGVKAGMKSYAQITRLAYSYKRKYGEYVR